MEGVNRMIDLEFLKKIIVDLGIGLVVYREIPESMVYKNRLERIQKLEEYIKVEEWWRDLGHQKRQEVMEEIYPDKIIESTEGWRYLEWKIKLEMYKKENPF